MVTWRGVPLDARTRDMMDEVCRLRPDLPIWPSQGSYSGGVEASAGTHSGGGAIDLAGEDMTSQQRKDLETTMRMVGFAAWVRGPDHGFTWHVHGIACDAPDLSQPARDQEDDYHYGLNGLADNGPDTGTRAYVGVTWETYQQGGKETGSAGLEAVGMIVGQHKRTGEIFVWNGTHKLELPVGGGQKSGDGHSAGNTGHVYVDEVLRMIGEAFPGSNPKFAALNPDILDRTPNA